MDRYKNHSILYSMYGVTSFLFVIILFSAPIAWLLTLLTLSLYSQTGGRKFRLVCGIVLIISWVIIAASRSVENSPGDDFFNYYETYQRVANGNLGDAFIYGSGFEFGFSIFLIVIASFSAHCSVNELVVIMIFISAGLYCIWLEFFGLRNVQDDLKGKVTAISWCYISLFPATQLTRQFLSGMLLLFALFSIGRHWKLIFFTLAASFHLSAIPVYLVLVGTFKYRWKAISAYLVLTLSLIFSLDIILSSDSLLSLPGIDKLGYYNIVSEEGFSNLDIRVMGWMVVGLGLLFFKLIMVERVDLDTIKWAPAYFLFCAIGFIMLPFPNMTLRTLLFVHAVIFGWLIATFGRVGSKSLWGILILGLGVKLYSILAFDPTNHMSYWTRYPPYAWVPGYYFFK